MEYQQQQQQQQFLHSSVIPRLTSTPAPKKPRPVSEATSISSSIVDYEYEANNSRVSRAPVYNYSRYEDMDLAEDEYEEHSEDDEFDDLYSKTKRMNVWLTGDERNSVGSVSFFFLCVTYCTYKYSESLSFMSVLINSLDIFTGWNQDCFIG